MLVAIALFCTAYFYLNQLKDSYTIIANLVILVFNLRLLALSDDDFSRSVSVGCKCSVDPAFWTGAPSGRLHYNGCKLLHLNVGGFHVTATGFDNELVKEHRHFFKGFTI